MDYTQYVEAPESFLRWSALSVIAGALERKVWINFKGQMDCYPNMYVIIVGPPGLVKKSTSSKKAFELLAPIEHLSFLATQFTDAALILQLNRAGGRKVIINNTEYNNSSVYIYASEAINTLKPQYGGEGNGLIRLLTDFYDCGKSRWSNDVGWSKETKGDGRVNIFNPCVNLLGCSVPDWLVQSIGKEDLKSGFASRCLFVVHNEVPKRSFKWNFGTPDMTSMESKLTEDLIHISHLTGEYSVSEDFKVSWDVFDKHHKQYLLDNSSDKMYGYLARKPWHILKLSQIVKASRSDEMLLTEDDWDIAIKLLKDIEKPMYAAFGSTEVSRETHELFEIWEVLRKQEKALNFRQILVRFINKDTKTIQICLMKLIELGKLRLNPGFMTYEVIDRSAIN